MFFYGDIRTRTCKKVCVTCIDKHLQHFSFYSQEELLVIVISIILLIGQKRTCYGPKEHKFLMRDKERATYKHKTQKKHEVSFPHFPFDAGLLHQILANHIIPSMSCYLTPLDNLECVCHPCFVQFLFCSHEKGSCFI